MPIDLEMTGIQHGDNNERNLVFAIPDGASEVVGAIGLEFVAFRHCRFRRIAFCVPPAKVDEWRDALAGRKDIIPPPIGRAPKRRE